MANKQTIAPVNLGGAQLKQKVGIVPMLTGLKQEMESDDHIDMAQKILSNGKNFALQKIKTDNERRKLQTAAALSLQRQELVNAQSLDEFNQLAKATPQMLELGFNDSDGQKFWQEHGAEILKANDVDVQRLRRVKEEELAKESLINLLADREEILAQIPSTKGAEIIAGGLEDIQQSELLSVEEKDYFKKQFLENGILNLALQDMTGAQNVAQQFCADNENLQYKLAETKKLQEEQKQKIQEQQERQEHISGLRQAFSLWQKRECGDIDDCAYYVLSGDKKNMLWGDKNEVNSLMPCGEVYKLFRNMHKGENIGDEDYENAANQLILAYKTKQIGLDNVTALQEKILSALEGKKSDDYGVLDKLADRLFAEDTAETSYTAKNYMDYKAKFYFELADTYTKQKDVLLAAYENNTGKISAGVEKSIEKEAMLKTLDILGYKESKEDVSFADLTAIIKENYQGRRVADIWQKYYQEAPFFEDKKALMSRLAGEKQKRELNIKRFDTLDEFYQADLDEGEQFYFQGRLAVKA